MSGAAAGTMLRGRLLGDTAAGSRAALSIGLSAAIVTASVQEPRVLTIRLPAARERRRTARRTAVRPARGRAPHAGDRAARLGRAADQPAPRLCRAALHLRRPRPAGRRRGGVAAGPGRSPISRWSARPGRPASADAEWQSWYRFLPVGGLAGGQAGAARRDRGGAGALGAAAAGDPERRLREERLGLAFGLSGGSVERGAGPRTLRAALRGRAGRRGAARSRPAGAPPDGLATGAAMAFDHRRILATAIGRLRGKIKYRPVVFELMPPGFTLLQLQRTVEALAGRPAAQAEFPPPGRTAGAGRGDRRDQRRDRRPAGRLVRFRREVLLERPAPGLRLRAARRAAAGVSAGTGLATIGAAQKSSAADRSTDATGAAQANRPGANGAMSIGAGRPATRSATIRPVIGAAVMPIWPWPKA